MSVREILELKKAELKEKVNQINPDKFDTKIFQYRSDLNDLVNQQNVMTAERTKIFEEINSIDIILKGLDKYVPVEEVIEEPVGEETELDGQMDSGTAN